MQKIWILLLIVLALVVLFELSNFDISDSFKNRASGFTQISVTAWRLAPDGTITMQFRNHAGSNLKINSITAVLGNDIVSYNSSFYLPNSQTSQIIRIGSFPNPPPKGSGYSINVVINYVDSDTNFEYGDSGVITGRVN